MKIRWNRHIAFAVLGSVTGVLALVLTMAGHAPAMAQSERGQALAALRSSSKILYPDQALREFDNGAERARFIVALRGNDLLRKQDRISAGQPSAALRSEAGKSQRRAEVARINEQAIASLNLPEAAITTRFQYMYGFGVEVTPQQLAAIIENEQVASVEQDLLLEAHLAQGIPLISASGARGRYSGSGVAVAIVDTGVDYTHPMLGGGGFPNSKVIGGYDTGQNDPNPMDGNGHGTACAGIAAGNIPASITTDYIGGVAPGAKIYALKITNTSTGGSAYSGDMAEAWEWCITHQNDDAGNPIMVISTSFGGGRYLSPCNSDIRATVAANALAAGITIFCSSGNDGYCNATGAPACISDTIAVGAVYDADFGQYYPCLDELSCATKYWDLGCSTEYYTIDDTYADMVASYSNSASFLDIFAPANNAYTTDLTSRTGYNTTFGGTSAACPYAAGAALVIQDAAKTATGHFLTPAQLKTLLVNEGDPVTDGKVAITRPRVNVAAVLRALGITPMIPFELLLLSSLEGSYGSVSATGTEFPWRFTMGRDSAQVSQ